jgi:tetraacyldisaccharide 4'-kinase
MSLLPRSLQVKLDAWAQHIWYRPQHPVSLLLLPLSWLFRAIVGVRRLAYRRGWLNCERLPCVIIVVGNLTVGGTGKTPFIIRLAAVLKARGRRVGIINRGYGGQSKEWPRQVSSETTAVEVGDEAVLLAQRTGTIVVSGPDRVAAARKAIELGADVVLCDDGLQHYRLVRDCEIAVVDATRAYGNGQLLPAGPLREPLQRLKDVALVVLTKRELTAAEKTSNIGKPPPARGQRYITANARLGNPLGVVSGRERTFESFRGQPVRAIAAVGHPEAFFTALRAQGLTIEGRALPDHAPLTMGDLASRGNAPVLMTEKDAVKCRGFADERHWAVPLELQLSPADEKSLTQLLDRVLKKPESKKPESKKNGNHPTPKGPGPTGHAAKGTTSKRAVHKGRRR